jgi:hypothetical protein
VRLVTVEETCFAIVETVLPIAATAAPALAMPEMSSAALLIESVPVFRSVESWSVRSFACWPDWVFGFPRSLRSDSNVSVADFTSSAALFTESCERFPPLSELPVDVSDVFQVVRAEQKPFAQSAADIGSGFEPHPAATSPTATTITRATEILRMRTSVTLAANVHLTR